MNLRVLILGAIAAAMFPTTTVGDDWPEAVRTASKSICRVKSLQQPTRDRFGRRTQELNEGTGCLVHSGTDGAYVLTAEHVSGTNPVSITIEFWNGHTTNGELIVREPTYDQALIKLDKAPPGIDPVEVFIPKEPRLPLGTEIYSVGYAEGFNLQTHKGVKVRTVAPDKGIFLQGQSSVESYGGMSGGPVFDRKGRLLGNLFAKGRKSPLTIFNGPLINAMFLGHTIEGIASQSHLDGLLQQVRQSPNT